MPAITRLPIEWAEKGRAQGRLRAALAALDGAGTALRRLLHLQEHGARADLPRHRAEVSDQGPESPHPGPSAQPLHPLLLLHPRRGLGADRDARGLVLSVPDHLLSQRPLLHRAGAQSGRDRLPQERQRLPRGRRSGGAAGGGRPAEPGDHPRAARLLDAAVGAEVLDQGARSDQPAPLLRHQPDRVLPQLHLQAPLPHPQDLRAQLRTRAVAALGRQDRARSSAPASARSCAAS